MPDLGDLHDGIISALDGASGGTCEHCVSGVFTKQADVVLALVDQFLSGHARPFADEWPATMVKAQLKVATAVLDSMKADDERAGQALETIARLAAESPDPGPQPEPDPEPEPPLPPGEYARVEIMGHDSEFGWVTERTRAGVPGDGRVGLGRPGEGRDTRCLAVPVRAAADPAEAARTAIRDMAQGADSAGPS